MLVHDSWLAMTNACRRCAGSLLYAFGDDGGQRVDDDERASRPAVGQWDRVVGETGRDWWQEGSRDSVGQGRKVRCSCAQLGSAAVLPAAAAQNRGAGRRPSRGAAAAKLADPSAGRLLAARMVRERWPDRGNLGRQHRESCAQPRSVPGTASGRAPLSLRALRGRLDRRSPHGRRCPRRR